MLDQELAYQVVPIACSKLQRCPTNVIHCDYLCKVVVIQNRINNIVETISGSMMQCCAAFVLDIDKREIWACQDNKTYVKMTPHNLCMQHRQRNTWVTDASHRGLYVPAPLSIAIAKLLVLRWASNRMPFCTARTPFDFHTCKYRAVA